MDKKNNTSTFISIGLHLLLFISLIVFTKPIEILTPSRSDGITVALVSSTAPTPVNIQQVQQIKNTLPDPVKTLDTPADVNLEDKKKQEKPKPVEKKIQPQEQVKPIEPVVKPEKTLTPPKPTLEPTPKTAVKETTKKSNIKADIDDLLGDATSTSTKGVRKGKALGGNPNGTSDSDNLISNYADMVIKTVRPFVKLPENISPKAKAIVKVELYPNLQVKSVSLIKSSGNHQYDENVQTAIKNVKIFPPLPDGAKFINYRIINLSFIPY